MAKRTQKSKNTAEDFLRDILIVLLGQSGVGQQQIRKIVGCDMKHVTRILKHFKKLKQK